MNTEDSKTAGEQPPRTRRWVWVLLAASLAVNLLIVGAIAGHILLGGPERHFAGRGGPPIMAAIRQLMREMPGDRRKIVREIIKKHRPAIKPLRAARRKARSAAEKELTAQPFDKAKFESALRAVHDAKIKLRKTATPMLLEIIEVLTPQEREKFLKAVKKRHARRGRRHGFGIDGPEKGQ